MANKQKESKKEMEQKEEQRLEKVHSDYDCYVKRIEARIAKGENEQRTIDGLKPLEVLDYSQWVRKAKRTINGTETEIEVSGDSGETKNEKFRRLGKARMTTVLADMDLLLNLASPQYDATQEDIEKMLNALRLKVKDIEESFRSQKPRDSFDF